MSWLRVRVGLGTENGPLNEAQRHTFEAYVSPSVQATLVVLEVLGGRHESSSPSPTPFGPMRTEFIFSLCRAGCVQEGTSWNRKPRTQSSPLRGGASAHLIGVVGRGEGSERGHCMLCHRIVCPRIQQHSQRRDSSRPPQRLTVGRVSVRQHSQHLSSEIVCDVSEMRVVSTSLSWRLCTTCRSTQCCHASPLPQPCSASREGWRLPVRRSTRRQHEGYM